MKLLKKYWMYILGVALGALGGYLYWKNVGCLSGTCPLTSSPYITILYGSLLGGLVGSMFKKKEYVENEINKKDK